MNKNKSGRNRNLNKSGRNMNKNKSGRNRNQSGRKRKDFPEKFVIINTTSVQIKLRFELLKIMKKKSPKFQMSTL